MALGPTLRPTISCDAWAGGGGASMALGPTLRPTISCDARVGCGGASMALRPTLAIVWRCGVATPLLKAPCRSRI